MCCVVLCCLVAGLSKPCEDFVFYLFYFPEDFHCKCVTVNVILLVFAVIFCIKQYILQMLSIELNFKLFKTVFLNVCRICN